METKYKHTLEDPEYVAYRVKVEVTDSYRMDAGFFMADVYKDKEGIVTEIRLTNGEAVSLQGKATDLNDLRGAFWDSWIIIKSPKLKKERFKDGLLAAIERFGTQEEIDEYKASPMGKERAYE